MSQNNSKKSNSISIAVWITVIGLAASLVFSFLGIYLKDGDMGMGLIISLVQTAVLAVLVWFMTFAKRKENDIAKWKIVEFSTLAVYIVVAVLFFSEPLLRFFDVNVNKDTMKEYAMADINNLWSDLNTFDEEQNNALMTTVEGLNNCMGYPKSSELSSFASSYGNRSAIDGFRETEVMNIENESLPWRTELEQCKMLVSTWGLFQIPDVVSRLQSYGVSIPEALNEYASTMRYPIIERGIDGSYNMREPVFTGFVHETSTFAEKIASSTSLNPVSGIIFVLLHLAILFSYYMAFRSRRVEIGRNSQTGDDGGILLRFDN